MTTAAPAPLDALELQNGPEPTHTLLWLHGLGDSGEGWASAMELLVRPNWPTVRVVLPHAPVRAVTANQGMRMRAWYDIHDFSGIDNRADQGGIDASVGLIDALIAREGERGVPPNRIVLGGFSQGAVMTLAAGARRSEPLAGLAALSSYLPAPERQLAQVSDAALRQPIYMAHGRHDPLVLYRYGETAAAQLRERGFAVEWRDYPIQHEASEEELAAVGDWIAQRFAAA
ncbi:alpha/beta fold hydrolase [Lysobacter sp. K5869]|uniref:alpha/beta hydrolase n=1 Tax=Lysobacter sp. K5869 TaxID=2820808 RepID=UPI001C05F05A|nr:alpha/beta fold hydrolase [Lysobacter sp. K5869]QWP78272.1 alpha/beta fold hydrolase [Lysobacter sp. K5869]